MFKFHKLAIRNAKPQNGKILMFTIVGFLIAMILAYLAVLPVQPAIYKFAIAQATQQPIGSSIFMIILAIIIPLVVFLFIGYPLISSVIYTIDKALTKQNTKFTDIFSTFKKGKYLKSVILGLITLIFFIVLMLVNLLLGKLLNFLIVKGFSALQGPISSSSNALGISLTIQIIAATVLVFILSFVYWLFVVIIVNYTLSFVKNPNLGAWKAVKQGFAKIKNGNKTWFKFYLGLLLLNLIVILFANPISQLVNILTGGISQTVAVALAYAITILVIVIRLVVYYINLLAIIQYHIEDGSTANLASSKKKKSDDKSLTNQVKQQTTDDTTASSNIKDDAKKQASDAQSKAEDVAKDIKNKKE